jgi:hypothetical protein
MFTYGRLRGIESVDNEFDKILTWTSHSKREGCGTSRAPGISAKRENKQDAGMELSHTTTIGCALAYVRIQLRP